MRAAHFQATAVQVIDAEPERGRPPGHISNIRFKVKILQSGSQANPLPRSNVVGKTDALPYQYPRSNKMSPFAYESGQAFDKRPSFHRTGQIAFSLSFLKPNLEMTQVETKGPQMRSKLRHAKVSKSVTIGEPKQAHVGGNLTILCGNLRISKRNSLNAEKTVTPQAVDSSQITGG